MNIKGLYSRNNVTYIITFIIAISIIISLFVDYYRTCKQIKVQVDYSNKYNDCRCKTFMTDTTILDYVLINGYDQSKLENIPNYTNFIYSLVATPDRLGIYYLDNIPEYDNVDVMDIQLVMPITNWNIQLKTMNIEAFVTSPLYLYIEYVYISSNGPVTINTKLIEGICQNLLPDKTSSTGKIDIIDENYINTYQLENTCLHTTQLNVSETPFVDISSYIYNSMIEDFNNNLFSWKNVKYCIPDYCLISSCHQGFYQLVLLSISTAATCYTVVKFIAFLINKKPRTKEILLENEFT